MESDNMKKACKEYGAGVKYRCAWEGNGTVVSKGVFEEGKTTGNIINLGATGYVLYEGTWARKEGVESENMKRARREYGAGVKFKCPLTFVESEKKGQLIENDYGIHYQWEIARYVLNRGKWAEIVKPKQEVDVIHYSARDLWFLANETSLDRFEDVHPEGFKVCTELNKD